MVIVLGLVVLFGVGQFFAFSNLNTANQNQPGQNGNNPATQVISYKPFAPSSSTPIKSGSCFAQSVAAPWNSGAWRCMVGNAISDPCFVIPGTSNLLCGTNPATNQTASQFILKPTKPLPTWVTPTGTISTTAAWLVELADGAICSPFTGTRPFTASGDVAVYSCSGSAPGELIFDDLNNANPAWTAKAGVLSTATSTFPPVMVASATIPVVTVWQ